MDPATPDALMDGAPPAPADHAAHTWLPALPHAPAHAPAGLARAPSVARWRDLARARSLTWFVTGTGRVQWRSGALRMAQWSASLTTHSAQLVYELGFTASAGEHTASTMRTSAASLAMAGWALCAALLRVVRAVKLLQLSVVCRPALQRIRSASPSAKPGATSKKSV